MAKNGGRKDTPKNIFKFAASLFIQLKLDTSQKIRGCQFCYQGNMMISRLFALSVDIFIIFWKNIYTKDNPETPNLEILHFLKLMKLQYSISTNHKIADPNWLK